MLFDRFYPETIVESDQLPPDATALKFFPNEQQFLVLGKAGEVYHFALDAGEPRLLGSVTLPDVAPAPVEIGLTGLAFDPQFESNRLVYFCYTTGDNRLNRIVRLRWRPDRAVTLASLRTVLEIERGFADEAEHGIYDLAFGADGALYAAIGDATQPETAQNPQSLLGKLIRIRPRTGEAGGYTIPSDNPFLDDPRFRPEIAALGLRSPFRLLPWRHGLFIADVGQNRYEEINLYTPGRHNYGWPLCEGWCPDGSHDDPVLAVSHADPFYQSEDPQMANNNALAISLGVIYPATTSSPYGELLDERLIFNDVFQGYVRAARIHDDGRLYDDQHIFHVEFATSMAIGNDGFLYGTTIFPAQIFRVREKLEK